MLCGWVGLYGRPPSPGIVHGGDEGARTPDLDSAIVALSQLSYVPMGETQYSTARATTQEQSPLQADRNHPNGFGLL
jgi:hypothetical protein